MAIGHGGRCCFLLRFGSTKLERGRRLIFVIVWSLGQWSSWTRIQRVGQGVPDGMITTDRCVISGESSWSMFLH